MRERLPIESLRGSADEDPSDQETLPDPLGGLSDEEFERAVLESLDQATTRISLRVPNDLLSRTNTRRKEAEFGISH